MHWNIMITCMEIVLSWNLITAWLISPWLKEGQVHVYVPISSLRVEYIWKFKCTLTFVSRQNNLLIILSMRMLNKSIVESVAFFPQALLEWQWNSRGILVECSWSILKNVFSNNDLKGINLWMELIFVTKFVPRGMRISQFAPNVCSEY